MSSDVYVQRSWLRLRELLDVQKGGGGMKEGLSEAVMAGAEETLAGTQDTDGGTFVVVRKSKAQTLRGQCLDGDRL